MLRGDVWAKTSCLEDKQLYRVVIEIEREEANLEEALLWVSKREGRGEVK